VNTLEPAPDRVKKTTWAEFLKTHWDVLAAPDVFTVDVLTGRGLTRFAVLLIIELSTRRVEIAGITSEPDAAWMSQVSRNVMDVGDGFLTGKRYLIHDRDPPFTIAFRETLASAGVQAVRLPARSPNLNAYAERFVRSVKESCLDRLILVRMLALNRSALVVRPRSPFLDWLHAVDPTSASLNLVSLTREPTMLPGLGVRRPR
jgi:putative transposase